MSATLTFVCNECTAMLLLPPTADQRAYHWRITPTGRATCPPCLLASGRVVGVPLTRVRAPGSGSTLKGRPAGYTGTTGDASTGVPVNRLLPGIDTLYPEVPLHDGVVTGGVGGKTNGKSCHDVVTEIPERLREFDANLRRHQQVAPTRNARRRYEPTARYYERIIERYGHVQGLDFTEESEKILSWMRDHPQKTTDVCRLSENWLEIAQERASKRSRFNGQKVNRYEKPAGVASQYGMGATSLPDDVRKSAADFERRGRGDDIEFS